MTLDGGRELRRFPPSPQPDGGTSWSDDRSDGSTGEAWSRGKTGDQRVDGRKVPAALVPSRPDLGPGAL